ncbi:hypothetical protein ISN44_As11g029870 [Arabidopsis suecica]|uniref:Uncharacterized protein n=1 Tax=Arabidopsis suecica TaxID=45249 RepID=A0A8T1ZDZ6_ARASU|nr:hypothetical protein ISN44_As11g029870 [Arabidopsis suecica]
MASPQGDPSDPNPPRFPSNESLFPTGDGFTPHGVAIPCFLSSLSKEEKIESLKGTFFSAPKGNALEENAVTSRIGLLELKGRSDVWSRMFTTGRGGDLTLSLAFPAAFENTLGSSSDEVPSTNSPPS